VHTYICCCLCPLCVAVVNLGSVPKWQNIFFEVTYMHSSHISYKIFFPEILCTHMHIHIFYICTQTTACKNGARMPNEPHRKMRMILGSMLWSQVSAIFANLHMCSEKMAFFCKTNAIHNPNYTKISRLQITKKRQFFRKTFRRKCFNYHNIGPGMYNM
jgi:hypothetical protein